MGLGDDIRKHKEALEAARKAAMDSAAVAQERSASESQKQTAAALREFLSDEYLGDLIKSWLDRPLAGTKFAVAIKGKNFEPLHPTPGKPGFFDKGRGQPVPHNLNFPGGIAKGQLGEAGNRARVKTLAADGIIVEEHFMAPTGPLILSVDFSKAVSNPGLSVS